MKHLNEDWAVTYILATLVGIVAGSMLCPTVEPAIRAVASALGLR